MASPNHHCYGALAVVVAFAVTVTVEKF